MFKFVRKNKNKINPKTKELIELIIRILEKYNPDELKKLEINVKDKKVTLLKKLKTTYFKSYLKVSIEMEENTLLEMIENKEKIKMSTFDSFFISKKEYKEENYKKNKRMIECFITNFYNYCYFNFGVDELLQNIIFKHQNYF